jgi:hypothetical protein
MELTVNRLVPLHAELETRGLSVVFVQRGDGEFEPRFGTAAMFLLTPGDRAGLPEVPRDSIDLDDPGMAEYITAEMRLCGELLDLALPAIRLVTGSDGERWRWSLTAGCACGCSSGFTARRRLWLKGKIVDVIISRVAV